MAKAKNRKEVLNIPVKFGGVSIGQETARIGVTFDRSSIELGQADDVFCGHRLSGRVVLGNRDDAKGQQKLLDTDFEVSGSFDTKRLSVSQVQIGAGLTFSLADVDIAELARFSKGTGRLIVDGVGEIPENAPDEHGEDADEKTHVPGSLTFDGDPKKVLMSQIFKKQKALLKSLDDAGITTVGELGEFTESGKKLADLAGIGPGKAEVIGEVLINFWSDNPQTKKK